MATYRVTLQGDGVEVVALMGKPPSPVARVVAAHTNQLQLAVEAAAFEVEARRRPALPFTDAQVNPEEVDDGT